MRVGKLYWEYPIVNSTTYYMSLVFVIFNVVTCLLLAYIPVFENLLLPEPVDGIIEFKPNIFGKNIEMLHESTQEVLENKKDIVDLQSRHDKITDKYKQFLESKYNTEKARGLV